MVSESTTAGGLNRPSPTSMSAESAVSGIGWSGILGSGACRVSCMNITLAMNMGLSKIVDTWNSMFWNVRWEGVYKRNALRDRVSTEEQHVILYFKLESRNNVVSMATTRTQIARFTVSAKNTSYQL